MIDEEVLDEILKLEPRFKKRETILKMSYSMIPPIYRRKSIQTTATTRTADKQIQASPMPAPPLLLRDHIPGEFLSGTILCISNRRGEFYPRTCLKYKNEKQVKPGEKRLYY